MRRNKLSTTLAFCAGLLLLAGLVQGASALKGDLLVFPGVGTILRAFFRLLRTGHTWTLIGTSLVHLLLSLAFSAVIGILLGLAEGLSGFFRAMMRPLMTLLRSMPMIVMIVILMVLLPYPRVPVTASSLFLIPLISEAACEGCRSIEPELLDVYRLNSTLNLRVLFHVHLPLMAGYLRQAWVGAVGMGLRLAISTEYMVQTRNSLGKAVYSSAYFNEYEDIYAYALIMILLILAVSELPPLLSRLPRGSRKAAE